MLVRTTQDRRALQQPTRQEDGVVDSTKTPKLALDFTLGRISQEGLDLPETGHIGLVLTNAAGKT